MAEKTKISELERITTFTGEEIVPVVSNLTNKAALLSSLKIYFKDSSLVLFEEIDDTDASIIEGFSGEEDDTSYAIVYLSKKKVFANRRRKEGAYDTYFSEFTAKSDYMMGGAIRADRAFFNIQDKEIYVTYGDALGSIFNVVRINAMTEEELENLENPIEGAFYATYEED